MTSLAALRIQRHAQWLRNLSLSLRQLVLSSAERPEQIYLFGSRARGDWEGLSDTDLLVVAASKRWTDQLLDHGLADDVIGLDREAWAHLPESDSVIWRNISKVAIPLLAEIQLMPGRMHGCAKPRTTRSWLSWRKTTVFLHKLVFMLHRQPRKA